MRGRQAALGVTPALCSPSEILLVPRHPAPLHSSVHKRKAYGEIKAGFICNEENTLQAGRKSKPEKQILQSLRPAGVPQGPAPAAPCRSQRGLERGAAAPGP